MKEARADTGGMGGRPSLHLSRRSAVAAAPMLLLALESLLVFDLEVTIRGWPSRETQMQLFKYELLALHAGWLLLMVLLFRPARRLSRILQVLVTGLLVAGYCGLAWISDRWSGALVVAPLLLITYGPALWRRGKRLEHVFARWFLSLLVLLGASILCTNGVLLLGGDQPETLIATPLLCTLFYAGLGALELMSFYDRLIDTSPAPSA